MRIIRFIQGAGSFRAYYRLLNELYRMVYGRNLMLHFPFYLDRDESFEQRQINLVDHCLSGIGNRSEGTLLEVGCGNGANCKYIATLEDQLQIIGIDLNQDNIEIACRDHGAENIRFYLDDAQKMQNIGDQSVDQLICIESALHYPDKNAFFSHIRRVLKPGGQFVIADILRQPGQKRRSLWWWNRTMLLHHATEEEYLGFASGNRLKYVQTRDITPEIVRGYEGHRAWIPKENRGWATYALLRTTVSILVRLFLRELRLHKKYMVFTGIHQ
jgi:cyclopropane fatty-acyl-phospholipid synthase-like methyltransferase